MSKHTVVDVAVDWNAPQQRHTFELTSTQDARIVLPIPADATPGRKRHLELYDFSDGVRTTGAGGFNASIAFGTEPNNWAGQYGFIETHFSVQVAGGDNPNPNCVQVKPGSTYYACITLAHGAKADGRKNVPWPFGAAVELTG